MDSLLTVTKQAPKIAGTRRITMNSIKTTLFFCIILITLVLSACSAEYQALPTPSYSVYYHTMGGFYYTKGRVYSNYDEALDQAIEYATDGKPTYIFKVFSKIEVPNQGKPIITIIPEEDLK